MSIIKSYILPHPPIIIPEIAASQSKVFERIIEAYDDVSEEIGEIQPDTIIILSPHAESYIDTFKVAEGQIGVGDLSKYGDSINTFRNVYDTELSKSIVEECKNQEVEIFAHGGSELSYDHGTTVPLYYINKNYSSFKLVRIGVSGLSYLEHYRLGKAINAACEKANKKVVFIASADFSHCQLEEGAHGFHEDGPRYDKAIKSIMISGDFGRLINMDKTFVRNAKSCGHRPLLVTAGLYDRFDVVSKCYCQEMHYGTGYGIYSFEKDHPNPSRAFGEIYTDGQKLKIKAKRQGSSPIIRCAYYYLDKHFGLEPSIYNKDTSLMKHVACFVSVYKFGQLRGCIGTLLPKETNLAREIAVNVVKAAEKDPRFAPIKKEELPFVDVYVDVLDDIEKIATKEQLKFDKYGVVATSLDGKRKGVVLPNAPGILSTHQQIEEARTKAGIKRRDKCFYARFGVRRYG